PCPPPPRARHAFPTRRSSDLVPAGEQEKFNVLPLEYSHLYLAIDGQLAAVICIADPLREEVPDVLAVLRRLGIRKTVMLTGDSRDRKSTRLNSSHVSISYAVF